MKLRPVLLALLCLGFASPVHPQDPGQPPARDQGPGGWQGQRSGRGVWGMGTGRGINGIVTEVAADHYTVRTDAGEVYIVHFSVNTRILKQQAGPRAPVGGAAHDRRPRGSAADGADAGPESALPPVALRPADIKVGDAVAAMGEVDSAAKSVGAIMILQIDPERARQLREFQANFGKTWLLGKVTAINETTVSLLSSVDNASHAFVADENTTFRKRREPITLADIQVGDMVRVEGAVKDGIFVATVVGVMGMPPGGPPTLPHDSSTPAQPQ